RAGVWLRGAAPDSRATRRPELLRLLLRLPLTSTAVRRGFPVADRTQQPGRAGLGGPRQRELAGILDQVVVHPVHRVAEAELQVGIGITERAPRTRGPVRAARGAEAKARRRLAVAQAVVHLATQDQIEAALARRAGGLFQRLQRGRLQVQRPAADRQRAVGPGDVAHAPDPVAGRELEGAQILVVVALGLAE